MLLHAQQMVVRPSWNGGVPDDVKRTLCRLLLGPPALTERFELFAAGQVVTVQSALFPPRRCAGTPQQYLRVRVHV